MTIYTDQFDSDSGWQAADSHVDAAKSISGGILTITAGTDYTTSLWTKTGFRALDSIVVARLVNAAGNPQIHVRETDEDNFLTAYIDSAGGNFVLAKRVSGTLTTLSTSSITDFSVSNVYTIVCKTFGDGMHALLFDEDDNQLIQLTEVSSDISDQTGVLNGVGAGVAASYSEVNMRSVAIMTNILCLGDSNTDGNNIEYWEEFPQVINSRRMFDAVVAKEAGKAGDNIAECEARVATEVAPFHVDGHRNVCILQMGTNDRADGFTAAQSWTRYQSCIATVKAAGFEAFVNNGFPNTKDDVANTQWNEDLNASIAADEATYGYTAVDVWTPFGGTAGSGFPSSVPDLWVTQNNPHASALGHLIFADEDLKAIAPGKRTAASSRTSASARTTAAARTRISQPRLLVPTL